LDLNAGLRFGDNLDTVLYSHLLADRMLIEPFTIPTRGGQMPSNYYEPKDLADFPNIGEYAPEEGDKFFQYYAQATSAGKLTEREKCLLLAQRHSISTIDITGGAPEMHPDLQWFLEQATRFVERLIVRSNLLILLDEACRHFIDIFAHNKVELVGSLPDYRRERS
jgi:hypothetical protein